MRPTRYGDATGKPRRCAPAGAVAAELDAAILHASFERSNLAVEINKIEAAHRSVFVAGWRPAVGWIGAAGVG